MKTRRDKIKAFLEALGPSAKEREGFAAFDQAASDLKKSLTQSIKADTLDEVNRSLDKVRSRTDLTPLLEKVEGIKDEFDTTLEKLAEAFDMHAQEREAEGKTKDEAHTSALESIQATVDDFTGWVDNQVDEMRRTVTSFTDAVEGIRGEFQSDRDEKGSGLEAVTTRIAEEEKRRLAEDTALDASLDELRKELMTRISSFSAPRGGGNANRNISIGGNSSVLSRYTDINLKAGANTTITYVNNDTTKNVDITIAATGGGGGGITRSIVSISVDTVAGATAGTDYVYLISGTTKLTLPTAVGNTNLYTAKNVGTGVVTIDTTGGETIDDATNATMPIQYTSIDLISNSANWDIT